MDAMDAIPTAPVSAPGAADPAAGAANPAAGAANPAAGAADPAAGAADPAAGAPSDQAADGAPGSRRVPPQRLTSDEFQVIAEDGRPDVTAADELPDTVVISYIDELLYPAVQGKRQGGLGAGQRLTPRVERSTFVRYGPTGTEQASLGYAHDLSLGGMFILSADPPTVGTDLQIELQLPVENRLERIRVQGRVMWHTDDDRRPPQGDGFGVQFTVVDRAASDAILRVVTRNPTR
jgi:Tfp pilus assembly protein PilZ